MPTLDSVSVIGLGKLGSPLAAAIASRGIPVVGYDRDPARMSRYRAGEAPVAEPGLAETLASAKSNLRAAEGFEDAVSSTAVTYVVVPTPSLPDGSFSTELAEAAFDALGRALKAKPGWHLFVMVSTVLPGACRATLIPALERSSGRRAGHEFGFCYSPAFAALGSAVRDFLRPDFCLIGERDERSGEALESLLERVVAPGTPFRRMSLENAELTKMALNTFVTTKIAFANALGELCDRLPGGDVDAVTGTLSLDRRIGPKAFSAGLGVGGPCFPRDAAAFEVVARKLGLESPLARSAAQADSGLMRRQAEYIRTLSPPGGIVALWGLSFKAGSSETEASPALALACSLSESGFRIRGWDPSAEAAAAASLACRIEITDDPVSCADGADVVVLCVADRSLQAAVSRLAPRPGGKPVVYDPWRLLRGTDAVPAGIRCVSFGLPGDSP